MRSGSWLVDGVWVPSRGGLSAAAHLQLLQDVMHVVLHRGGTDRQLTRDVLVGATLIHERQDFALARREGRQWWWRGFLQEVGEAIEHRCRDVRRAVHAALYRVHQGTMQLVGAAFAWHIAGESGTYAYKNSAVDPIHRKGPELGSRICGLDQPSYRDGIPFAHVDKHDIEFGIGDRCDPRRVHIDGVHHHHSLAVA